MASTIKVDQIEGSTGSTITVPTGQTLTITDGLAVASLPTVTVAKGGTNLTSFTAGDVLYATGATTLAKLAKGTAEQVLAMNAGATAPDWGSVDLTVLPTITVAKGGTNLSSFTAGDILYATGATTLAKLAKGSAADLLTMNAGATAPEWAAPAGGGKLLQVVQSVKTDTFTTTSTSEQDISDLSVAITPSATSSKIWITASISVSRWADGVFLKLKRDIGGAGYTDSAYIGDAAGSRQRTICFLSTTDKQEQIVNINYLDSTNTTDEVTYKAVCWCHAAYQIGINRSYDDSNNDSYGRGASSITVMEIGA